MEFVLSKMASTSFLARVVCRISAGLLLACLFISLCPEWVHGQDFRQGYIVRNGKDTVRGLVAYRPGKKGFKECLFKPSKKEKSTHLSPDAIEAYGLTGDAEFVSVTLPPDFHNPGKVFIRRLVRGPLSLYAYRGTFVVKKDTLVTLPRLKGNSIKVDGRMVYQENKRYAGLLNLQLQDCSMSANTTKYTGKELTSLVNNYNRCKGQMVPINAGNRPGTRVDFQAFGGFMQSNLTVNYLSRNTFSPSKTVFGGIGIDAQAVFHGDLFFTSVAVTDYGFVWSNNSFPNINTSPRRSLGSTTTAGPFEATIQGGLIAGKEYTVQAYATSTGFEVYGTVVKFTSQ